MTHHHQINLVEKLAKQREQAYQQAGTLEPMVMAPISPNFNGEPRWPNRNQSWRYIKLPTGNTLIISDGIANSFDDEEDKWEPTNGAGAELYFITPDPQLTFENLPKSPYFQLVVQTSHTIAQEAWEHPFYLPTALNTYKYLSITVNPATAPPGFLEDTANSLGVLIGLTNPEAPQDITTTETYKNKTYTLKTQFTGIAPLKTAELNLILQEGAEARKHIGNQLNQLSVNELSNPNRKPVL